MHDLFAAVADDLHDARRVHAHGQEDDFRHALARLINRVDELSTLLKLAYQSQSELENSLSVAQSNLQLMMSNNEMLEEALQRETPSNAKDVGWRRWSAREAQNIQRLSDEERSRSLDYGPLNESGTPSHPASTPTIVVDGSDTSRTSTPSSSTASLPSHNHVQETRFFRFRFNSGSKSSNQHHPSHLTSPSLPSLVASSREKELSDLKEQLDQERHARQAAAAEKTALEAELESLSQALFEEANKMVATERIKCAQTEEELQQVQSEKDALKQALRLLEGQNVQLRSACHSIEDTAPPAFSHSRSSSRVAIKSRSPSPSSPASDDLTVSWTLPSSVASSHPLPFPEERVSSFPVHSPPLALELATSVSFIPDEPSPWAGGRSSST